MYIYIYIYIYVYICIYICAREINMCCDNVKKSLSKKLIFFRIL